MPIRKHVVVSRRLALRGISGGLLAAVPTAGVAAQSTPEAGVEATPTVAAPELLRRWAAGWSNLGDPSSLLAIVAPDVVYEDVAVGDVVRGGDRFRALLGEAGAAIPDFRIELLTGFATDDTAAAEYVISGTQRGDLPYLRATGRAFRIRAASIFDLAGGTIRRESRYYNMVAFLSQLGALPASALPPLGTPPAAPPQA